MSSPFVEVVDESRLQTRVAELGAEIAADYGSAEPVVIGILKGSVPFLADLTRHLPPHIDIDFLALTRFGREGRVRIELDTSVSLVGRSVLLVEDIVDTGLTLATLRRMLVAKGATEVRTVSLLDKAPRRIVDVPLEYRGFEVGDEFLLGYGLDWQGLYRNVRSLWAVMDLAHLTEQPDALAAIAFRAPTVTRG